MKRILAVLLAVSAGGCALVEGVSNLARQFVIASIDGDRHSDAFVRTHRSPSANRQTWTADTLFTNGSGPNVDTGHGSPQFTTTIFGRGGSSPGIGANGRFYVMAFWGRPSNVPIDATSVSMFLSVSHDGIAWTTPFPFHSSSSVHSNSQGIVSRAGISVASEGVNGDWFAAYADDSGAITVVPLPVTRDGDVLPGTSVTPAVIAGASTNRAPALSYFGNSLVLAWRVPGGSGLVLMLTTTDGTAWPSAASAVNPLVPDDAGGTVPLAVEDSAPFLHNSLGDLFLTSTRFLPGTGAGRVGVHRSSDGARFDRLIEFGVSDPLLEGAAAAGPEGELVVVYPTIGRSNTTVFGTDLTERTIATSTNRRVTIAFGP